MVARRETSRMTIEEWRALEQSSHDVKHEYIDGWAYAMPGGSPAHGRIATNAIRTLEDALVSAGGHAMFITQMSSYVSHRCATPIQMCR